MCSSEPVYYSYEGCVYNEGEKHYISMNREILKAKYFQRPESLGNENLSNNKM